jgi:hypothetical protein
MMNKMNKMTAAYPHAASTEQIIGAAIECTAGWDRDFSNRSTGTPWRTNSASQERKARRYRIE